jgi:hypothetical protein
MEEAKRELGFQPDWNGLESERRGMPLARMSHIGDERAHRMVVRNGRNGPADSMDQRNTFYSFGIRRWGHGDVTCSVHGETEI